MTGPGDSRRQTPLAGQLAREIATSGPIGVDTYIRRCLSDPQHGYYTTRSGIGRDGDFTTAPEISQAFGELIGLWAAVVWQQMGAPAQVNLVEFGPGRGELMSDALRAGRVLPGFLQAADLHLCEINPTFRRLQAEKLEASGMGHAATWHDAWPDLAARPTIIIANEFLDTMPGTQWRCDRGGAWQEIRVGVDAKGQLDFISRSAEPPFLDDPAVPPAPDPEAVLSWVDTTELTQALSVQGAAAPLAALFIDYGHVMTTWGDTLQAVRGHQPEHPLCSPGEADLSLAVDFAAFQRAIEATGLAVDGPVTQAEYLGQLGIAERASKLMAANPARANEIESAVFRLMAAPGMGTRFHAIAVRSTTLDALPGFAAAPL
ncbi:MAG: class I SAM-dependent methyltransferase [Hyphomicrobiaceae bacterium]